MSFIYIRIYVPTYHLEDEKLVIRTNVRTYLYVHLKKAHHTYICTYLMLVYFFYSFCNHNDTGRKARTYMYIHNFIVSNQFCCVCTYIHTYV